MLLHVVVLVITGHSLQILGSTPNFLLKSQQKEREQTVFCGKKDQKEWVNVSGIEVLMGFQGSEVLGQTAWEWAEPPALQSSKGTLEVLIRQGKGRAHPVAWK